MNQSSVLHLFDVVHVSSFHVIAYLECFDAVRFGDEKYYSLKKRLQLYFGIRHNLDYPQKYRPYSQK